MDLNSQMQKWVAYTSVGASTVRGLNTPGVATALRRSLAKIDLKSLQLIGAADFPNWLNEQTTSIKQQLPRKARFWGVARKCLNIFLRGACYNVYLRETYNLKRFESELELPLDSLTVNGLKEVSPPKSLPRWQGVKHLTPEASSHFQRLARHLADQRGYARIHLDVYLWVDR